MITVTIAREDLVKKDACEDGLDLFDAITSDPVLTIENWTPLHSIWLLTTGHENWLFSNGFVPRADLRGAYLRGAYLRGADLRGADLRGAYLRGADLSGADLSGADLSGAYLRGAYLSGAYLRGAYLSGADLRGAYLSGADLSGADLRGADLRGAYLSDATRSPYDSPIPGWHVLDRLLRKDT